MPAGTDWLSAARAEAPRLTEIRRHLHMHPELSFEEHETSKLVVKELKKLDVEIRTGFAKGTGVVAILRGTAPGADARDARAVALRADMDALPIEETSGLPYASKFPGKMHACGHDGHTATLLGTVAILAAQRERLKGTVVCCFQPAEEGGGGGRYMVNEGVLDDPQCTAAFALHGIPNLPIGQVGVKSGPSHAASDSLRIVVRGRGGHGAAPHMTVDPIVVGARIVEALQTVVSREVNPIESAVVTIGAIHAGKARNVIPDSLEMLGTIRTLKEDVRRKVHAAVRRTAEGICAACGAQAEIELNDGYPVMVNNPAAARFLLGISQEIIGSAHTQELLSPSMGGEDFGYFLQKVPGAMFRLGVATQENYPALHNPAYNFTDDAIPIGAAIFCGAAEQFLHEGLPA